MVCAFASSRMCLLCRQLACVRLAGKQIMRISQYIIVFFGFFMGVMVRSLPC